MNEVHGSCNICARIYFTILPGLNSFGIYTASQELRKSLDYKDKKEVNQWTQSMLIGHFQRHVGYACRHEDRRCSFLLLQTGTSVVCVKSCYSNKQSLKESKPGWCDGHIHRKAFRQYMLSFFCWTVSFAIYLNRAANSYTWKWRPNSIILAIEETRLNTNPITTKLNKLSQQNGEN